MNKYLLIPVIAIIALNVWLAIPALATEQRNQDALIIEHKYSLIDEQIDDEAYEQSEQYKTARYANEFLANNRSDK